MADNGLQLKDSPKKISDQELERDRKIVLDSIGEKNSFSERNDILKPISEKETNLENLPAEPEERIENFPQKAEKNLPVEKPKDIPADDLIQTSNQQRFQEEKQKEIEKILQNGLENIYLSLSPDKQREFKTEGEKATKEINILLSKTKVNVGKIIALIRKWLSVIPGVNKFFLEQETKIKADQILKLKE
jgi:flagellar biosynthesis GTPase FlhF